MLVLDQDQGLKELLRGRGTWSVPEAASLRKPGEHVRVIFI